MRPMLLRTVQMYRELDDQNLTTQRHWNDSLILGLPLWYHVVYHLWLVVNWMKDIVWLVTGCHLLFSQKYWVSNRNLSSSNWRTHIFQRGGRWPWPTRYGCIMLQPSLSTVTWEHDLRSWWLFLVAFLLETVWLWRPPLLHHFYDIGDMMKQHIDSKKCPIFMLPYFALDTSFFENSYVFFVTR